MTKNKSNGEPQSKAKKIGAFVGWIAAPATVTLLSPWYLPLLKINLFPDYFRPLPQVCASIAFLLSFLAALGFHRRTSQERMRKFLRRWLSAFVVSFVVCFVTTQAFSFYWDLDASWELVVHPVWLLVYAMVFASLAFAIVLAAYLILGNDA